MNEKAWKMVLFVIAAFVLMVWGGIELTISFVGLLLDLFQ